MKITVFNSRNICLYSEYLPKEISFCRYTIESYMPIMSGVGCHCQQSGHELLKTKHRVMRIIDAVRDWISSNRLRLNADQTQFIILARNKPLLGRSSNRFHTCKWGCQQLESLLRSWIAHRAPGEQALPSVLLSSATFENGSPVKTKESLLTLVHAFITSRVDQCSGVLYGSNRYPLDRLQSFLNSAARLISGVPKFVSISAAISNVFHWLPIGKRIQFKIALLLRHCIVGAAPEYLIALCRPVSLSSGRQSLRSALRGDLIVPRFRLQRYSYRAFAVSGPHVWNSLSSKIRQSCDNLLQFKSKLKTFLFKQLWVLLWFHI